MDPLSNRIKDYEQRYANDYGFEKVMVWARQKYIAELIYERKPAHIVEIGCGLDQLFDKVADNDFIKSWTIIEPADRFVTAARERLGNDGRVRVIQGFVEQVSQKFEGERADLCICSSLLHEVKDPLAILRACRELTQDSGLLHVNVPNATSMHRMLAVEMGLISSPYEFSDRNRGLSQFHVFDTESLKRIVSEAEFSVGSTGGYLIKPFTHSQMERVIDAIGEDVLSGLWSLGRKFPELASEIFVNAIRGNS